MAGFHLYKTARWRAKRRVQLHNEPLCAYCQLQGKVTAATVADHIVPHRKDEQAFWSNKLQSLCSYHHNSTKQSEEANSHKPRIGLDGWPVDEATE